MSNYFKLILLGIIAFIAAMGIQFGRDLAYQVHAALIFVIASGMFVWVLRNTDEDVPMPDSTQPADPRPACREPPPTRDRPRRSRASR